MEIQGLNALPSAASLSNHSTVNGLEETYEFFGGQDDRIKSENAEKRRITQKAVRTNLKSLKSNIELHDEWSHIFIGKDHIKLKGDGKMTYGKLREALGIPPRALSETNKRNLKDTDVIEGTVTINLEDIGWFERSMDENEASQVRAQRSHGDYSAGWERALNNEAIIQSLK